MNSKVLTGLAIGTSLLTGAAGYVIGNNKGQSKGYVKGAYDMADSISYKMADVLHLSKEEAMQGQFKGEDVFLQRIFSTPTEAKKHLDENGFVYRSLNIVA